MLSPKRESWLVWGWGVLFVLPLIALGYNTHQHEFVKILGYFAFSFCAYFILLRRNWGLDSIGTFVSIAIIARLALLFAFPALSDDIYRFIWDGHIWLAGENPFDHLPGYWLTAGDLPGLNQALYDQLNSPEYYTIYPPVCQLIFTAGVFFSPDAWWGAALIMKLFLVGFEIRTIFLLLDLLGRLQLPRRHALLYALNPLVIIEISGNLHFEGAMVFFLLLGIRWIMMKREALGAVAIALSIASKLLPLMLLPLLIGWLGWKRAIKIFAIVGVILILLFLPLFSPAFINNFGESLELYFQKFEFNASIYYLVKFIGQAIVGYNPIEYIGPALALVTVLLILGLAIKLPKKDTQLFLQYSATVICIHLLLSTTIHPWYLILPMALFAFTSLRFVYLWSFLICLTYMNYSFEPYQEQSWWVVIEYLLILGMLIWEISRGRLTTNPKV